MLASHAVTGMQSLSRQQLTSLYLVLSGSNVELTPRIVKSKCGKECRRRASQDTSYSREPISTNVWWSQSLTLLMPGHGHGHGQNPVDTTVRLLTDSDGHWLDWSKNAATLTLYGIHYTLVQLEYISVTAKRQTFPSSAYIYPKLQITVRTINILMSNWLIACCCHLAGKNFWQPLAGFYFMFSIHLFKGTYMYSRRCIILWSRTFLWC